MAPYAPFLAEELYQNLVRSTDSTSPESVHLTEFPTKDETLIDQPLMEATRLAMKISSLGRDARSRAGKKVRVPLQTVVVRPQNKKEIPYFTNITSQILEELNVKQLTILKDDDPFYQKVIGELKDVRAISVDGFQIVSDNGYLVGVDTNMTASLAKEGLARELVHRIQNMRRSSGLHVTDRISIHYQGSPEFTEVISSFRGYICEEVLADEIVISPAIEGSHIENFEIDGLGLTIGITTSTLGSRPST